MTRTIKLRRPALSKFRSEGRAILKITPKGISASLYFPAVYARKGKKIAPVFGYRWYTVIVPYKYNSNPKDKYLRASWQAKAAIDALREALIKEKLIDNDFIIS